MTERKSLYILKFEYMGRWEISVTRLLVLGLLERAPMSGYDIQQAIRCADAERWGGVLVGSIYHALNQLEREGHISRCDTEYTGRRQRTAYRITDQGREHLSELILNALCSGAPVYPTELYSGLSLLELVPKSQARKALREQLERLEEEIQALERGQRSNRENGVEVPLISELTIAHMVATVHLQRRFVVDLLEGLEWE